MSIVAEIPLVLNVCSIGGIINKGHGVVQGTVELGDENGSGQAGIDRRTGISVYHRRKIQLDVACYHRPIFSDRCKDLEIITSSGGKAFIVIAPPKPSGTNSPPRLRETSSTG